jgi:hypothetical protein
MQVSLRNDLKLMYSSYTQRDPIRHIDIDSQTADTLAISSIASHSV